MNVSKTLTSTIAAAAIIGAISVAYAQTSQGDASPTQQNQTLENSNSTSQGGMSTPLPSDSSVPSYQGERPAQADRN